jgi:hypothetical protein
MHWPLRRGYHWYRFKYMFIHILNKNLSLMKYLIQFLIYLPIVSIRYIPYYNLNVYFICLCLIDTLFHITMFNLCYRLSSSIRNKNIYFIIVIRLSVLFVYSLIICSFTILNETYLIQ